MSNVWYVFNRGDFIASTSYKGSVPRAAITAYYGNPTIHPKGVEAAQLDKVQLRDIKRGIEAASKDTIQKVKALLKELGYKKIEHVKDSPDDELFIFRPPNGDVFSVVHEKKLVPLMRKLGFRKDYDSPRGERSGPCGWTYGEDNNSANLALWRGDM